jgi:hypothetical protein
MATDLSSATRWLVFLLCGAASIAVMVAMSLVRIRMAIASRWSTVQGMVIASLPQRDRMPYVQYKYMVGGQLRTSDQVYWSGVWFGKEDGEVDANGILAKYPTGSHCTVHFNPRDPRSAFLEMADRRLATLAVAVSTSVFAGWLILFVRWAVYGIRPW